MRYHTITLDLHGMDSAASTARLERRLNRLDGVAASVNPATEEATVRYPVTMSRDALATALRGVGLVEPTVPGPMPRGGPVPSDTPGPDRSPWQRVRAGVARPGTRLWVAVALAPPVVAAGLLPPSGWSAAGQWATAVLAGVVTWYSGWRIHATAVAGLRRGVLTVSALISAGTLLAYLWSVGMLVVDARRAPLFDAAAAAVALVLVGQWLEAAAKRRASADLRALGQPQTGVVTALRPGTHLSVAPSRTAPHGATPDGTAPDGTAPDGATPDGTAPDGTAPDGTAPDGTAPDGTAPDGSVMDGSVMDGSVMDGTPGDGPVDPASAGPYGSGPTAFREERIPADTLRAGDRFLVRYGETVPADGIVEQAAPPGERGEPGADPPARRRGRPGPYPGSHPGMTVIAGTVYRGGPIIVRAIAVGAETRAVRAARVIARAQVAKTPAQRLAEATAGALVPAVLVTAVGTAVAWTLAGGGGAALAATVAVLLVSCPAALALAAPSAWLVGTARGGRLGILVGGPRALHASRRADAVLLEKTGTVTAGKPRLVAAVCAAGVAVDEALRLAGAVEQRCAHPVAQVIARDVTARLGVLPPVTDFTEKRGLGASGVVDGRTVIVGRPRLLWERSLRVPAPMRTGLEHVRDSGYTAVAVGWDGEVRAVLALADPVKPTSAQAVTELRELGLRPALVTGDGLGAAQAVADRVGVDEVIANVLPADKVEIVRGCRDEGLVVAVVGDERAEASAMTEADMGVAVGAGADVALRDGDIAVTNDDLRMVADGIKLSRRILHTARVNLVAAFGYNLIAVPLAAFGLIDPVVAGVVMAFGAAAVVGNSLRLRRFRPLAGGQIPDR